MTSQENVSNNNGSMSNTQFDNRKGIRLNKFEEKNWDPEYIREKLDSITETEIRQIKESLSKGINKTIWLNERQSKRWDPHIIRFFLIQDQTPGLTGNDHVKHPVGSENRVLKKGFKIASIMFNEFMHNDDFKAKVRDYFSDDKGQQSQDFSDFMKAFNLLRGK